MNGDGKSHATNIESFNSLQNLVTSRTLVGVIYPCKSDYNIREAHKTQEGKVLEVNSANILYSFWPKLSS